MHDRGLVTTAGGNLGPDTNVTNTETWSHMTQDTPTVITNHNNHHIASSSLGLRTSGHWNVSWFVKITSAHHIVSLSLILFSKRM